MSREKLSIQNLLSWEEVLNFCPKGYFFDFNLFYSCALHKNSVNDDIKKVVEILEKNFLEQFPDSPFSKEDLHYYFSVVHNENEKPILKLSIHDILFDLIISTAESDIDQEKIRKLLDVHNDNFKENVIQLLKKNKQSVNDALNCLIDLSGKLVHSKFGILDKDKVREKFISKRKIIVWLIRNFDDFCEYFDRAIDINILNCLNKDKFLFDIVCYYINLSGISTNGGEILSDYVSVVNDYKLLVDYMSKENQESYKVVYSFYDKNNYKTILSSDTILRAFIDTYNENKDKFDCDFCTSYEEVLQNRANQSWKRMQSNKIIQNIKLNWEMIPTGTKINISNYNGGRINQICVNDEKKQAKLKKDYDLVEEKIEYFSKTNPLLELTGINTFEGYSAYMYSNGVVVFEKFFKHSEKKGKELLVPVSGEAIYVMNFQEFADLSQYTKMELIQEINQYNNPNVKRILHTANGSWKDKVNKEINGSGYGELCLEQLNTITDNLANSSKVLLKK